MDLRPYRFDHTTGSPVSYYFTREYPSLDCPLCRARTCVQRVEYSTAGDGAVRVVHGDDSQMS